MVHLRRFYIIFILLVLGSVDTSAQLNGPEKILLDSFSIYPQFALKKDRDFIIGGVEKSCHIATVWRFDENFNKISKKQLIHDSYEISEMYDMKMGDSSIEVLTWQLEIEDVASDEGIKWYSLNTTDFSIQDSMYVPEFKAKDGLFLDSFWVINTWDDSLAFISAEDGRVVQKIPFSNAANGLLKSGSSIVSWHDTMVFMMDSTFKADTLYFDHNVLDITTGNDDDLYVLTSDSVWHIALQDQSLMPLSRKAPEGASVLLFQPYVPALVTITEGNTCIYFDPDSLMPQDKIQLFYNTSHEEDLKYVAFDDGSILRLGTTQVKVNEKISTGGGQRMGFLHRFDDEYTEDTLQRSDMALKEISIMDDYYGSKPKLILGDSAYFISKDSDTKIRWKFENVGTDPVFSGFTSTNQIFASNCAEGFYSQLLDTVIIPGAYAGKEFQYFKYESIPSGYEEKIMVYTAYPNGRYDADFSNNQEYFTFRYVLSGSSEGLSSGEIEVFPNPANERVHIKSAKDLIIQNVVLVNMQGEIVAKREIDDPSLETWLDISFIPDGICFIRIQTSQGYYVIKKLTILR